MVDTLMGLFINLGEYMDDEVKITAPLLSSIMSEIFTIMINKNLTDDQIHAILEQNFTGDKKYTKTLNLLRGPKKLRLV